MDTSVLLQLIVTIGAIISGMLLTVRYAINQGSKKEKFFLDYLKDMQEKQLEYYEVKNGHLERISNEFSKTINKNTRAIDKLSNLVSHQ